MSSISSVALTSLLQRQQSSTPPTPPTIWQGTAYGFNEQLPMVFMGGGLPGNKVPIDDGSGINPLANKGEGGLANNPIVKAAEAFIGTLAKGIPAGVGAKIGSDLWGKYGSGIMSALSRGGNAVLNFITSLFEDESAPRSAQAAQPTTTLSQGDQTLLRNLMTSAKQAGVASLMPGAVKAVFTAMQSSGAIVDTTA
uniref:Uncharacterized protein n=1 Tax=mine drainage metagenome TaxID=410659 RepID=E6Q6D6_9ZZZZ